MRPRRLLLGAFGDPGHAFPMIALGRALAARGHQITLQTWRRWQEHVEAEGLTFAPAPEYEVFPSGGPGSPSLDFYEAVVHAAADTTPLVRELRPHVAGGISRQLALVATFPQLESPRAWPAHVHLVGPLMWEPPAREVELPREGSGAAHAGRELPLVLVAPSTAQDSEHRLLLAALRGLAEAP